MGRAKLQKNYLVTKTNVLNEMRSNSTLQELRLFSIYLSRINPQDKSTRVVRFPIAEFKAIMGLSQIKIPYLKKVAENLVHKIIYQPTERGGFSVFPIFSRFTIDTDENGDWYAEINANDEALPLLFDFKDHYFKYELWNALRLKSKNQLRMYEILKQYEYIGHRIISIQALKARLGIEETEYPQFKEFKRCILDVCQKALAEYTDISFSYEPYSKKGRKIFELKFTITKNANYKDPLSLDEFIGVQQELDQLTLIETDRDKNIVEAEFEEKYENNEISFFAEACNNEFSNQEIWVLFGLCTEIVPQSSNLKLERYNYMARKYNEMKYRADTKKGVKHRFGYLKFLLENDLKEKRKEIAAPISDGQHKSAEPPPKRSRFANFKGHDRDWEEIARKEQELVRRMVEEE